MKFCPQCGAQLAQGQKYCQECGQALNLNKQEKTEVAAASNEEEASGDSLEDQECLHEHVVNIGANEAYCNECTKYIDLETGQVAESAKPGSWPECQHLSLEKDLRGPNGERICAKCGSSLPLEVFAESGRAKKISEFRPFAITGSIFLAVLIIMAFLGRFSNSSGNESSTSASSQSASSQSATIDSKDMLVKFNSGLRTIFDQQSQLTNLPDINQAATIYTDPDIVLLNYPDADAATKDGGIVLADLGKLSEQTSYWTCSNVMVIYPSEVKPLIAHIFSNWCDMGSDDTIDKSNDGYKSGYSFYLHAPDVPTLVNAGESITYGPDGNKRDYVRTFKWCAGLSTTDSLLAANTNSAQSQSYYDSESAGCADAMMKRN